MLLAAPAAGFISCSPTWVESPTTRTLNPIEILEASPRVYSIGFKAIADSIETARASAYLRASLDYGASPGKRALEATHDSTLYSRLTPRERAEVEYLKAQRRYDSGAYEAVSGHLKRAMAADASYRPPYLLLGEMLLERGALEQATDLYTKVLTWDAADSDALVGLARCYIGRGNVVGAKKSLVDAVIFNRLSLAAWRYLGAVAAYEGKTVAYRDAPDLGQARKVRGRYHKIVIDDSLEDCPVQATAWIAYASERAVWRYEDKYKYRFGSTRYLPTYEEDVDCYMVLAAAWKTLASQDSIECDREYLDFLDGVADSGYLVSHVLFDYSCVQSPAAARYFSVEVIDRLRDYVNTYVVVPKD
jgi:tetratricopeptide (TPR) repeat protein